MCLVDGTIQIFAQPVLAGLLSGLTLEAGDKATGKPQSRIKFLAGDLNLVLQLDQAVKGVAVDLDRNNSFIRCNKSVYRRNVDVRRVVGSDSSRTDRNPCGAQCAGVSAAVWNCPSSPAYLR